jgi:hypothetical protein
MLMMLRSPSSKQWYGIFGFGGKMSEKEVGSGRRGGCQQRPERQAAESGRPQIFR